MLHENICDLMKHVLNLLRIEFFQLSHGITIDLCELSQLLFFVMESRCHGIDLDLEEDTRVLSKHRLMHTPNMPSGLFDEFGFRQDSPIEQEIRQGATSGW